MKRYCKLIILFLVILIIYFIFKNNNSNNITYISLGDHLALGVNSYEGVDYGYSDYVKDYLAKEKELKFYTKAYASKDMSIDRLYSSIITNEKMTYKNKKLSLKEIIRESDFLTLTVGINDLIYKMSITNNMSNDKLDIILEEIRVSFDRLISEIKKYYHNDIYFVSYYENPYYSNYTNYAIRKLNRVLEENKDIIFISTEELFKDRSLVSSPRSPFPNSKGYKKISELIIEKL